MYNHVEFDSFGKITSQTNASHEVTTGYTDPATKLQNNRRRWYDPLTRIWVSQNPERLRAGDVNLYRYVGNAPTNFTDPSGLLDRLRPARPNAWRMNRWNSPAAKTSIASVPVAGFPPARAVWSTSLRVVIDSRGRQPQTEWHGVLSSNLRATSDLQGDGDHPDHAFVVPMRDKS